MRSARIDRRGTREGALTLVLLLAAVLIGLALRTPTPQPADYGRDSNVSHLSISPTGLIDYCTGGNHVIITTDHAQTVLGAPECKGSK